MIIYFVLLFVIISIYVWKWKVLTYVWLFATPYTVAHQALLSMELSRKEYWSG